MSSLILQFRLVHSSKRYVHYIVQAIKGQNRVLKLFTNMEHIICQLADKKSGTTDFLSKHKH